MIEWMSHWTALTFLFRSLLSSPSSSYWLINAKEDDKKPFVSLSAPSLGCPSLFYGEKEGRRASIDCTIDDHEKGSLNNDKKTDIHPRLKVSIVSSVQWRRNGSWFNENSVCALVFRPLCVSIMKRKMILARNVVFPFWCRRKSLAGKEMRIKLQAVAQTPNNTMDVQSVKDTWLTCDVKHRTWSQKFSFSHMH